MNAGWVVERTADGTYYSIAGLVIFAIGILALTLIPLLWGVISSGLIIVILFLAVSFVLGTIAHWWEK